MTLPALPAGVWPVLVQVGDSFGYARNPPTVAPAITITYSVSASVDTSASNRFS